MTDINELKERLARLERHVGTSNTQLLWEEYVDKHKDRHEEILEVGVSHRPYVTVLSTGLLQKTDWKLRFDDLVVKPHDSEHVKMKAFAPDNWQEKLD